MANFNFTNQAEYALNTSLAQEMINLYGVLVKFLVTEKINIDDTVFDDYSHLKSDSSKIYDMYMLPENTEDWDTNSYGINNFGLVNFETVNLFAAKSNFDGSDHDEIKEIVGNVLVLPNNKVMEVTNAEITVPGVNNLFTYADAKSVYKLTCKPYDFKLINELNNTDISADGVTPYETLDNYFQELINQGDAQDTEATITPQVDTVDNSTEIQEIVVKPIVDEEEVDPWGQFS